MNRQGQYFLGHMTPPPSGAFTVSGANPNAAGTVFTAAVEQELTLVS